MADIIAAITENVNVIFTISADVADFPETLKKYL